MDTAPANGAAVRVYRVTPLSAPLVDFTDGATLVAADLDTNAKQSIYTQQELDDELVDGLAAVIPNGDKGDITTSVGGTVWTIDAGAVTSAKILDGTILNADVNASAGIAAGKLSFTQAGTGATARTVDSRLKDVVSVKDFGAVGDGITNDATAISNAFAASGNVYMPPGSYLTTAATQDALTGKGFGPGKITTNDGNKTAGYFSLISAAPSSLGNEDSIDTAFNGDYSKCQFPVSHRITGGATLGQPTTGYLYRPEAMPHYTYLHNASGWNQSTSGNGGRTGVAAYRAKVFQSGQGDAVCYNGSVFVTGTKSGSTNFLANPAGVLFNGDMQAGANGVYLNPYETVCADAGYDIACIGLVNNFNRTNATGAKSAVWQGYRAQSTGAATCDALISATGKWVSGLDLSMSGLDFGANKAAISLKGNDRIYFNNAATSSGNLQADWRSTVFNGDYIEYNSAGGFIHIVRGGISRVQISTSAVVIANANLLVNPTGVAGTASEINGVQGGFALPTGTVSGVTFDTATVTLNQLAQYVAYLVQRLHKSTSGAHGLIGP